MEIERRTRMQKRGRKKELGWQVDKEELWLGLKEQRE